MATSAASSPQVGVSQPNGSVTRPATRADDREVEHDRGRRLAPRQRTGLHRRAGAEERADQPERRAGDRNRVGGAAIDIEMRRQHHQHAGETDDHRAPAIDAHVLLEKDRRQRHREQRRDVLDRGGVDHRQPRQRGEIAEHGADCGEPASEMPPWTADADRRHQFASPRIDDHHRHDREGGTEEHHLPDRICARRPSAPTSTSSRTGTPRSA